MKSLQSFKMLIKDRLQELKTCLEDMSDDDDDNNIVKTDFQIEDYKELYEVLAKVVKIHSDINEFKKKSQHFKRHHCDISQDEVQYEDTTLTRMEIMLNEALEAFGKITRYFNASSVIYKIIKFHHKTLRVIYKKVSLDSSMTISKYENSTSAKIFHQQMNKFAYQGLGDEKYEMLTESNQLSIFTNELGEPSNETIISKRDGENICEDYIKTEHMVKDLEQIYSLTFLRLQRQKSTLDNIEDFVQQSDENVNSANKELCTSALNKTNERKKKILQIMWICLCLTILTIVLYFK